MQKLDELFPDMPLEKRMRIKRLESNNMVVKEYEKTLTKLGTVLNVMFENNLFEPIYNMEEIMGIGVENNNDLEEYVELDFDKDLCCRAIESNICLTKMKETEFTRCSKLVERPGKLVEHSSENNSEPNYPPLNLIQISQMQGSTIQICSTSWVLRFFQAPTIIINWITHAVY